MKFLSSFAFFSFFPLFSLLSMAAFLSACSFNYGDQNAEESMLPDITMKNVDYMRVKNGNPQVRLKAVTADRYDKKNKMTLNAYQFDQYDNTGKVDASGQGGHAEVLLDNLDVSMNDGIKITVDSEDITMQTEALQYNDTTKALSAPEDAPVNIDRSDGTTFQGTGLSADVRSRTFAFDKGASGLWVQNSKDSDKEAVTASAVSDTELPGYKGGRHEPE